MAKLTALNVRMKNGVAQHITSARNVWLTTEAFINKTYQDLLIKGLIIKIKPFLHLLQQRLLSLGILAYQNK